jgi:replicative DNA helicase
LYFILESTALAQTFRRLANRTGIPLTRLRIGNIFGDGEWESITKACGDISDSKLWVIDNPQYCRFESMQALCETLSMDQHIALIVVDFLQLMSLSGNWQSEHHKFKNITIQFNHLAKNLRCPFLILSQLNVEGQLKESRDIYSNADHVWRLERQGESKLVKFIFEKGRDTGTATKWLEFDTHHMRFTDYFGEPPTARERKDIDL